MTIDIAHIARLAHLEFTGDELSGIYKDMENIVQMIGDLPSVNDDSYNENNENSEIMELRNDEISKNRFTRNEMLKNAPCVHNGCIEVPKTFE